MRIWEATPNKKGGLLGRPVKLIYYDDKSAPAEVPCIYTKLLDRRQSSICHGPYATTRSRRRSRGDAEDKLLIACSDGGELRSSSTTATSR